MRRRSEKQPDESLLSLVVGPCRSESFFVSACAMLVVVFCSKLMVNFSEVRVLGLEFSAAIPGQACLDWGTCRR